jgi:NAD(P)-dependent dehydrogenase (short-subunit alcohol dehydrogenase family)
LGAEAMFIQADVTNEAEVRHVVDRTVQRFGRLDMAANSAGTEGKPGAVIERRRESYAATFDTRLSMKHELRVMQAYGAGSIINISSTMGERGAANMSIYTGTKRAVGPYEVRRSRDCDVRGARQRRGAGTNRDGDARKACGFGRSEGYVFRCRPDEARRHAGGNRHAILFVASDKASYITGQIIRVNGGKTAS